MNRRHFLAQAGAGTAVVVGGCLDGTDAAGDTEEPPGPTIDGQPCPPYATDRDRTVCSHTVDPDTASVYLAPDPQSGLLDEITLTLFNQFATDLRFNPHSWRIWYRSDTDWTELDQQRVGDGVVTVSASATYTWSFMETVESIRIDPELNPGLYAAEIGVPNPTTDDEWIACTALVRFDPSE